MEWKKAQCVRISCVGKDFFKRVCCPPLSESDSLSWGTMISFLRCHWDPFLPMLSYRIALVCPDRKDEWGPQFKEKLGGLLHPLFVLCARVCPQGEKYCYDQTGFKTFCGSPCGIISHIWLDLGLFRCLLFSVTQLCVLLVLDAGCCCYENHFLPIIPVNGWMFYSPQMHMLKSNPQCECIWRWGFGEVIRSWGESLCGWD